MRKPIVIAVVLFTGLALLTVGLVIRSAISSNDQLCEVCITFRGRSQCREAYGTTREEAIRTATDNACSFLASGMTSTIACGNTPPTKISCEP